MPSPRRDVLDTPKPPKPTPIEPSWPMAFILGGMALVAIVVGMTLEGPPSAVLLVAASFALLGGLIRLAAALPLGDLPRDVALAPLAAAILLLPPWASIAVSLFMGAAGALRRDDLRRTTLVASALTMSTVIAEILLVGVRRLVPDDPIVGSIRGQLEPVGTWSAILGALVLVVSWRISGLVIGRFDARRNARGGEGGLVLGYVVAASTGALIAVVASVQLELMALVGFALAGYVGRRLLTDTDYRSTVDGGLFRVALADEVRRSQRFDRPVAVAFVNLTGITSFVPRDRGVALTKVAHVVQSAARHNDVVGLMSRSQLAIMLPESSVEGAESLIRRTADALRDDPIRVSGNQVDIRLSAGVAAYPRTSNEATSVMADAEMAAVFARLSRGDGNVIVEVARPQ